MTVLAPLPAAPPAALTSSLIAALGHAPPGLLQTFFAGFDPLAIIRKYARFASLEAMFDASKNVAYGARYLKELNRREGNWTQAVARYHAGAGNDVAQRKYVCSVIRRMVTEGLGGWTPSARQLCGGENNIK